MTGRIRARELGLPFAGQPGALNLITDVPGVEVGLVTLVSDSPATIRTGVTALLPRGRKGAECPCFAATYSFNGNGEMTGTQWIAEAGLLQTPIVLTNTNAAGRARDAVSRWLHQNRIGTGQDWGLPVAAETWDGDLNDIDGFHVSEDHVFAALDAARSGVFALGNTGGGTGMITYDFKGGTGSASRRTAVGGQTFTLGVLVQSNFGRRSDFMALGVPLGLHLTEGLLRGRDGGSLIGIIATDAPLLPHQLARIARRASLGMARTGTVGSHSSGDIFLAFSTGSTGTGPRSAIEMLTDDALDPLFRATVEAMEEAILDAVFCGETMRGLDGNISHELPAAAVLDLFRRYGRLDA